MLQKRITERIKKQEQMAILRDELRQKPKLRYLFIELTDCCNLHCLHCGSNCCHKNSQFLRIDEIIRLICLVKEHEPYVHVCLSGGEPLLHPQFDTIIRKLHDSQLFWSVVTNGTLIDMSMARQLKESGVYSVSVSLDGGEVEHNELRQSQIAFSKAVSGIHNLRKCGITVQITTVVTKKNLHKLDSIYGLVKSLMPVSWKVVNIEPIGRATENQDLQLSREELLYLLDFIRIKRAEHLNNHGHMNVTFGCSHFLPLLYEEEVRESLFLCGAGITIAGIQCNGDISACLDIERRAELVQGNIYRDDFWNIWETKFHFFRKDRTEQSEICRNCKLHAICAGDSLHTWDFNKNGPKLCLMRNYSYNLI